MVARIYQPARNAMQSGTATTDRWILDPGPLSRQQRDALMGWTGAGDTRNQVRLTFDTKEAAIAYAEKHGIAFRVDQPNRRKPNIRPGGYGDNFATNRRQPWSH